MEGPSSDPKAGEKSYYARLGPEGMRHAVGKPFTDPNCGRYLTDLGALLMMMKPPPGSVLDFGCGAGWTSLFLARVGYEVLGVDISTDAVAAAKNAAQEAGVQGATFIAADYEGFQPGREFDYVLFYDSLHHAEDEQAAISAAWRSLKKGGVLFALEPGAGHSQSPGSRHAVEAFGVHEKDMPPSAVWRLGRRAGFRRSLFLPMPSDTARTLYRRDYFRASGMTGLWLERAWGYFRALSKTWNASRRGLLIMWK